MKSERLSDGREGVRVRGGETEDGKRTHRGREAKSKDFEGF